MESVRFWDLYESTLVISVNRPVLEIRELRKKFGTFHALNGMSLSLGAGERLALLGPNGAGKTTMIRCLSGRVRPDSGSILLQGQSIDQVGARDAIGIVPQEIAIYEDLSTRDNLVSFGRFHGLRGGELRDRVDWALQWTGLADRAKSLVGSFSGGMKRRVNLACGVLHSPTVLLLDEPTVGVDPQSRERIFVMLDELSQQGTSILLTTHHLDEAQLRCDRIVIVDAGQVIAEGTFPQLIDQTVGRSRWVTLTMDRPLLAPLSLPSILAEEQSSISSHETPQQPNHPMNRVGECGDETVSTRIRDVASQLPLLLDSVRQAGYAVADLEVQSPTLHHVFLHLTGRELRD